MELAFSLDGGILLARGKVLMERRSHGAVTIRREGSVSAFPVMALKYERQQIECVLKNSIRSSLVNIFSLLHKMFNNRRKIFKLQ